MKKHKKGRKLSRTKNQRNALMKSLASALFLNEKIRTTQAKAQEMRSFAEKFITRAKKENLAATRLLAGFFQPKVVKKLISDIGPRYKNRAGGYTRIIKLGPRKSDGSKMAIIELIK